MASASAQTPPPPTSYNNEPRNLIRLHGKGSGRCGYCGSEDSFHTFGMWAYKLDVRDYQAMINAGWRRSGHYCYRPDLQNTCCPCYVIRLDASRFTPSSTHNRVMKRLRRAARKDKEAGVQMDVVASEAKTKKNDRIGEDGKQALSQKLKVVIQEAVDEVLNSQELRNVAREEVITKARASFRVFEQSTGRQKRADEASKDLKERLIQDKRFASNIAMVLAAEERRLIPSREGLTTLRDAIDSPPTTDKPAKKRKKGLRQHELQRQMQLATHLQNFLQGPLLKFCNIFVSTPGYLNFIPLERQRRDTLEGDRVIGPHENAKQMVFLDRPRGMNDNNYKLVLTGIAQGRPRLSRIGSDVSTEKSVSGADEETTPVEVQPTGRHASASVRLPDSCAQYLNSLAEGEGFSMELVPAQFMSEAYEVFLRYQTSVHKDHPSRWSEKSYRSFLIDSPLGQQQLEDSEELYGSFHILYRLWGRIFAVSTVDILPKGLSSVYLFYDPDFAKLSPGVLSAVKETNLVRLSASTYPSMKYYYMGFYIHSCPKMRYKGGFKPSELLCDETKTWIPVEEAQARLDASSTPYTRISADNALPAVEAQDFVINDADYNNLVLNSKIELSLMPDRRRYHLSVVDLFSTDLARMVMFDELFNEVGAFIRLVGKSTAHYFAYSMMLRR